ncbi:MAG: VWA domain-containing protein [Candidatus Omnitrophota bacterium]
MFEFRYPAVLFLMLLVPIAVLILLKKRSEPTFIFSSRELVGDLKPTLRSRLSKTPVFIRAITLILLILALARPQSVLEGTKTISEGVDMVLALDTSTSMLAEDFTLKGVRVNRFDLVREVVKEFIQKRKDDRIGMVAFAARAYTVCPLTTNYSWLIENLDRVTVGMIEDGTAIGSAIASSCNRLRTSKTKSRIVILLTDGVSNAGSISPIVAAEAAKALGVKIYTICVGRKGLSPYPFRDPYGRKVYQNIPIEIDEDVLKRIASITGGKYYLATDSETLRKIYEDINKLEKSVIEHFGYREYSELFYYFLIPALILIILEILLTNTIFMRVP